MDVDQPTPSLDRRRFLRRAGAAGAVAWAAPQIIASVPAGAQGTPPDDDGPGPCVARGEIFFDDFSQEPSATVNYTNFVNWDVSDGTVDAWSNLVCAGNVVDLDGSTFDPGLFSLKSGKATQQVGKRYTVFFELGSNGANNAVEVVFGPVTQTFPAPTVTCTEFNLSYTATSAGDITLSFQDLGSGGDNDPGGDDDGDNGGTALNTVRIVEECPPAP